MGVYDSIEQLKAAEAALSVQAKNLEGFYRHHKGLVLHAEMELEKAKRERNKIYKSWKASRALLTQTQRKIKNHPSQVRAHVKKKPFEIFEQ